MWGLWMIKDHSVARQVGMDTAVLVVAVLVAAVAPVIVYRCTHWVHGN